MSFALENIPVTKGLLLLFGLNTIGSSLTGIKHLQLLRLSHLQSQPWRALSSQLIFSNTSQLIFGSILLYNLRVIEKHYGSVKFGSLYVVSSAICGLLQIGAMLTVKADYISPGPLAFIHCLLVYHSTDTDTVHTASPINQKPKDVWNDAW
jgi:membrane associated rhomboid family serine protease